jgi:hypothetical protein
VKSQGLGFHDFPVVREAKPLISVNKQNIERGPVLLGFLPPVEAPLG